MTMGKRKGLYVVAGVLTTATGNKVVAGTTRAAGGVSVHVVDPFRAELTRDMLTARPATQYADVGDITAPDWSLLWPYGGEAA